MMHEKLLDTIKGIVSLSDADAGLCRSAFGSIHTDAHEYLTREGAVPTSLFFVNTGYVRLFYTTTDAEAITTNLAGPGDFVTDFLPFVQGKPTNQALQTVTKCDLLKIEKNELAALIATSETFKQFSLVIFEKAIGAAQERANDLATLSAEQRYRKLLSTKPHIVQQVPVQYIASYLGIQPESLSRIRRQIIS